MPPSKAFVPQVTATQNAPGHWGRWDLSLIRPPCPDTPRRGRYSPTLRECPPRRPRPAGPPVPSEPWAAGMARAAGPERRLLAVYTGGTIGMRSERGGEWGGRPARGGGRRGGRAPAGRPLTRPDPRSGGRPGPPTRPPRAAAGSSLPEPGGVAPVGPPSLHRRAGGQVLKGCPGLSLRTPGAAGRPRPLPAVPGRPAGSGQCPLAPGDWAVAFAPLCPGALTGFGSGRGDCWAGEGLVSGGAGPQDPGAGVSPGRAERLEQEPGPGSMQGWAGHRTHPRSVAAWPPRGPRVLGVGVLALQEGPRQPLSLSGALPCTLEQGRWPSSAHVPSACSPALGCSLRPQVPRGPHSWGRPTLPWGVLLLGALPASQGPPPPSEPAVPPNNPQGQQSILHAHPRSRGSPEAATQMPRVLSRQRLPPVLCPC